MVKASIRDLRAKLDEYIAAAKKQRVVVVKNGKPVAMLVPPDEDTLYEFSLLNSPRFLAVLAESQRQIEAGEYCSIEEFRKRLERKSAKRSMRAGKPPRKKQIARR